MTFWNRRQLNRGRHVHIPEEILSEAEGDDVFNPVLRVYTRTLTKDDVFTGPIALITPSQNSLVLGAWVHLFEDFDGTSNHLVLSAGSVTDGPLEQFGAGIDINVAFNVVPIDAAVRPADYRLTDDADGTLEFSLTGVGTILAASDPCLFAEITGGTATVGGVEVRFLMAEPT